MCLQSIFTLWQFTIFTEVLWQSEFKTSFSLNFGCRLLSHNYIISRLHKFHHIKLVQNFLEIQFNSIQKCFVSIILKLKTLTDCPQLKESWHQLNTCKYQYNALLCLLLNIHVAFSVNGSVLSGLPSCLCFVPLLHLFLYGPSAGVHI